MDSKSMIKEIAKDMGHSGNIASSAITLAVDRSLDIKVPPLITLMMLKKLCEVNIRTQLNTDIPKGLSSVAEIVGLDIDKIREDGHRDMEKLIDDYFDHQKLRGVKV